MGYIKNEEPKKVVLPSNKDYWVKVRKLRYGDLKQYLGYGGMEELSIGKKISLAITEWNLDDEAGKPLPIEEATIDLLQENDVDAIAIVASPEEDDRLKGSSSKKSTATSAGQS